MAADLEAKDLEEYEDDPDLSPLELARRRAKRWDVEMEASQKELKQFRDEGRQACNRFRDDRTGDERNAGSEQDKQPRRLNVYTSDKQVLRDTLFGAVPKVDVSRRFGDSRDSAARVAGELLQRVLNADIEGDEQSFTGTMEKPLFDFLVAGLGVARARYVAEFEQTEAKPAVTEKDPETGEDIEKAPAVEAQEQKSEEDAETFYVNWKDFAWSPCPTWADCRWVGFKCEMSRQGLFDRFTEPIARQLQEEEGGDEGGELSESLLAQARSFLKSVPLSAGKADKTDADTKKDTAKKNYPWARAEVWEIWDKDRKQVCWWMRGVDRVLDCVEDPLGLKGFWPMPEPLMANLTNDKLVPTSDWKLARSLYEEVDELHERIGMLQRSVSVKGVYDRSAGDSVSRVVDEALHGELVPVDNWAMFAEKGGMKGVIDWFPIDTIVEAMDKLCEKRAETLDLLRQITGMADIIRGQQQENGTPGEAEIKAHFASVRMRALQKRFARFASELQAIKAEIISKHFSDANILARSNARFMLDAPDPEHPEVAIQRQQTVQAALQLIHDRFHEYRIVVRPESIAAEDFAQKTEERTQALEAMSKLFSGAQPMVQAMPGAMPGLLQIAKWAFSGLKGGKEIEGVFDEMVESAQRQAAAKAAQPPPPNPDQVKAQTQAAQAQAKLQELQIKGQQDLQRIQAETAADAQRSEIEARAHDREQQVAHGLALQEAEHRARVDVEKARAIHAMKPPAGPPNGTPSRP